MCVCVGGRGFLQGGAASQVWTGDVHSRIVLGLEKCQADEGEQVSMVWGWRAEGSVFVQRRLQFSL